MVVGLGVCQSPGLQMGLHGEQAMVDKAFLSGIDDYKTIGDLRGCVNDTSATGWKCGELSPSVTCAGA